MEVLILPLLALIILIRMGLTIKHQLQTTHQFTQHFLPFRKNVPTRLQKLLKIQQIPIQHIVYLNLNSPHAFCLGFWRPSIWITEGLLNLLSDQELAAVLAHEVYHYQHRDPLRLLISRALKSAFFFLPVISNIGKSG